MISRVHRASLGGGGGRFRRVRGGGPGRGDRRGGVGLPVALRVGAVEAALERPCVRRRRADALPGAAAVAARGSGREAPAQRARGRRRGPRRGRAAERALLACGVDVVGRHYYTSVLAPVPSDLQMPKGEEMSNSTVSNNLSKNKYPNVVVNVYCDSNYFFCV